MKKGAGVTLWCHTYAHKTAQTVRASTWYFLPSHRYPKVYASHHWKT